jgi:hypothetical protein
VSPEGVRSTPRDVAVLRWLGEQYGAPLELFGVLLERFGGQPLTEGSRRVLARTHAARLERLGYAGRRWSAGQRWIVPSAAGLRTAALPFEAWEPVDWKLDHTATVGRLRLWIEDRYPGATWESERWVRYRWHEHSIKGRVPDGIVEGIPEVGRAGVELELSRKSPRRYPEIIHATDPTLDEVWWVVPAADVVWLRGVLEPLTVGRQRPIHRVVVIPEGISP